MKKKTGELLQVDSNAATSQGSAPEISHCFLIALVSTEGFQGGDNWAAPHCQSVYIQCDVCNSSAGMRVQSVISVCPIRATASLKMSANASPQQICLTAIPLLM